MHSLPAWSVLIAAIMGCTTRVAVSPTELGSAKAPSDVWVTRADGSVIHVHHPVVVGDTLAGFVNGRYRKIGLIRRGNRVVPARSDSSQAASSLDP